MARDETGTLIASFPGYAVWPGNETGTLIALFPGHAAWPGNKAISVPASFPGYVAWPGNEAGILMEAWEVCWHECKYMAVALTL